MASVNHCITETPIRLPGELLAGEAKGGRRGCKGGVSRANGTVVAQGFEAARHIVERGDGLVHGRRAIHRPQLLIQQPHKITKHWGYLATNYSAWAQVENAEDLSRSEQSERAIEAFV